MASPAFHALSVRDVRRETANAVSIAFAVPSALADLFAFKAGQYLTLKAEINGEDVRRTYSICAAPGDNDLRIAVKRVPGGIFSTYANEALRPGDRLELLPAAGHFTENFVPGRAQTYAAFAAGSGITPVISLIKTALTVEPDSRFTLFYGNRRSGEILFLEELAALKNRFMARLEIFHFLSGEEDDIALFNGRFSPEKCAEITATLLEAPAIDRFFICGPEPMMLAAESALLQAGVAPSRILLERFAAAGTSPAQNAHSRQAVQAAAGRRMGVVLEGKRVSVAFDAARGNILDSVRAAGLAAPYACKGGVCATCRARLISGSVEMRRNYGLTLEEVAQGFILTCQSTPNGDDVVLTYDL
jgi:ring-1,2-phenylacetyl-CoA epoxidase subunit PaaE